MKKEKNLPWSHEGAFFKKIAFIKGAKGLRQKEKTGNTANRRCRLQNSNDDTGGIKACVGGTGY